MAIQKNLVDRPELEIFRAGLTLEGPIIKDKWSFIVSGRRTYADVVGRLIGIEELKGNKLYFYDLNLKTNIQFSHKDRLFISAYTGDDNFKLGESIYMRWGNITGTARWNHIYNGKLFSNTSIIYSHNMITILVCREIQPISSTGIHK